MHFGWHFLPFTPHLQPPEVSPWPCERKKSKRKKFTLGDILGSINSNDDNKIRGIGKTHRRIGKKKNYNEVGMLRPHWVQLVTQGNHGGGSWKVPRLP